MKSCLILLYIFALTTKWVALSRFSMSSIYRVFPTFYDVHGVFRWHCISLPTKAHRILTCVSVWMWKSITPLPTCMDVHYQCCNDIRVKSCSKWSLTSGQYFVIIGRFAFLVYHLTKLEMWPGMLLALWPNFKILCMMIVLFFVFGTKHINSTFSWNTSWTRRTFLLNNDWIHHAPHPTTEVDHKHGYNVPSHCQLLVFYI
jgi:hypothetical protein